jgi:IS5 family transposase
MFQLQYFCGERFFQWGFPCDPSELVHFRKRIGEEGVEKIFTVSVELHRDKIAKEDELVADTTVQEANITYPTDTKLRRRVIETLWRLGEDAGITWERSHRRLLPRLLRVLRTRTNRMASNGGARRNGLRPMRGGCCGNTSGKRARVGS